MAYNDNVALKLNYEQPSENGNIAEKLDDDSRSAIGSYLLMMVNADIESRSDWIDQNTEGLKLAAQIMESKNFPWRNSSNVKFPLITTAAMQFNSRALPAFINSGQPVKAAPQGSDPDGTKTLRAQRVAAHMSYQCMEEDEDWVDDLDRLLLTLPISGQAHRKRYYSVGLGRPASRFIVPQDMIISFDAKSSENARRTEVLTMSTNEVKELEMRGRILEVNQSAQRIETDSDADKKTLANVQENGIEEDVPFTFYEVHWNLDLDGDGYREPYIALIHAVDGQLVSLSPRWVSEGVETDDKNQVLRIKPTNFYTDYFFIPNPMSNTHGLGFGHLLGPINGSVNTLINQLIDAGTLATLQGGFVGRGVKMKGGEMALTPGQWKSVNATGSALRDNIFPLPVKDPSSTLFQLLGMLIQAGKEISSVTEMMQGQNPGQNTAATTAQAMVEQGMQVFTGIFARIHRALGKEHKQLFMLNKQYHDVAHMEVILDSGEDAKMLQEDYNTDDLNIKVASDPNMITDVQLQMKEQGLGELVQMGQVNPQFVAKTRLKRLGYTPQEMQEAMTMPEPQPDPKILELQLKTEMFEHQKAMDQMGLQNDQEKVQAEAQKDLAEMQYKMAQIATMEGTAKLAEMQLMMDGQLRERKENVENMKTALESNKLGKEAAKLEKETSLMKAKEAPSA